MLRPRGRVLMVSRARPFGDSSTVQVRSTSWILPALLLASVVPSSAFAHLEGSSAGAGFLTGFLHPLGGADHVLAMLAVGMWGAQLGNPAIWVLPVAFPQVMALGGVAGILGLPLPAIEVGVTVSVIVLGSMIALEQRPPLWAASLIVAFFAVFHGYAHGAELPGKAGAVAYSAGFVTATGLIHLTGIGIGLVVKLPHGARVLRAGGGAIAVAGLLLAGRLLLR
jgi:urease accessory protein